MRKTGSPSVEIKKTSGGEYRAVAKQDLYDDSLNDARGQDPRTTRVGFGVAKTAEEAEAAATKDLNDKLPR
jgi:hypothetical protein